MPPKRKGQLSKAGAGAGELSLDEARALLRRIRDGETLEEELLLLLAHLGTPSCGGTCKSNDKNNPSCFCGIIPQEGSFKKKGLWKKEPDLIGNLGADPKDAARLDLATPCGLNNLGNTCYVNSALQCLFMVPSFRLALYKVPPPVSEQPIVARLRELFLALNFGPKQVVDPTAFADSLNLNHAIQQDGQEFFKLLLGKLESMFSGCSDVDVQHVVPTLFRGQFSYITVCKSCGQLSSSSDNATDFHELPLQVKGFATLEQSMASALTAELLDGDNQYACDICAAKRDASRQMVLRTLPPYMCLQLQRFVFDYEKMDKMKASDKFTFPLTLDMPSMLASVAPDHDNGVATSGPEGQPPGQYELMAVLIHKGNSASHGHYVAHIKVPDGQWWRFDDETVAEMGATPHSHPGDHGTSAAAAGAQPGSKASKEEGGKSKGGKGGRKRKAVDVAGSDDEAAAAGGASDYDPAESNGEEADMEADQEEEEEEEEEAPRGRAARGKGRAAGGKGRAAASKDKAPRGRGRGRGAASKRGRARKSKVQVQEEDDLAVAMALSLQEQEARQQADAEEGFEHANGTNGDVSHAAAPAAAAADAAAPSAADAPAVAAAPAPAAAPATTSPSSTITSANAYMLLYKLKGWQEPVFPVEPTQLPAPALQEVETMRVAYEAACVQHVVHKQEALEQVAARRKVVSEVLASAAVTSADEPSKLVPSAWLESWAVSERDPKWDMKPITCPHGKVHPLKVQAIKRISQRAWDLLLQHSPGLGPAFSPADLCSQCTGAELQKQVLAGSSEDVRKELEELLSQGEGEPEVNVRRRSTVDAYYISRTWLQGWLKRKSGSMNTDASPTTAITCPHNTLAPKAVSLAIPGRLWHVLKELWLDAQRHQQTLAAANGGTPRKSEQQQQQQVDDDCMLVTPEPKPQQGCSRAAEDDDVVLIDDDDEDEKPAQPVATAAAATAGAPAMVVGEELAEGMSTPPRDVPAAPAPAAAVTCLDLPVSRTEPCAMCQVFMQEKQQERSELRRGVTREHQQLPHLALNVLPDLQPGITYKLVPRHWLRQWQRYVNQNSKRTGLSPAGLPLAKTTGGQQVEADRPGPLAPLMASYLCPCHPQTPMLRLPPPEVVAKRSKYEQAEPLTDELVVISADEWEQLWRMYGLSPALDQAAVQALAGPSQPPAPEQPELPPHVMSVLQEGFSAQLCLTSVSEEGGGGEAAEEAGEVKAEEAGPAGSAHQPITMDLDDTPVDMECDLTGSPADAAPAALPAAPDRRSRLSARSAGTPGEAPAGAVEAGGGGGRLSSRATRGSGHSGHVTDTFEGIRSRSNPPRTKKAPYWLGGGSSKASDFDLLGEEAQIVLRPAMHQLQPSLTTTPPPCDMHVQQVLADVKRQQLSYDKSEVMVEVVASADLQGSFSSAAGERRSRRARKGRQPVTVSSSTTLHELKLQIWGILDIHPGNAQLYVRGSLLEGEERTLRELEVYPEEEVRVVVAEVYDNNDVSAINFPGAASGKPREVETGFKDTALLSGPAAPPSQAVTRQEEAEQVQLD